jgi:hypothetical protein
MQSTSLSLENHLSILLVNTTCIAAMKCGLGLSFANSWYGASKLESYFELQIHFKNISHEN